MELQQYNTRYGTLLTIVNKEHNNNISKCLLTNMKRASVSRNSSGSFKKLKSSNLPSSSPPSDAANVQNGYTRTNAHLRSILVHPIGFILAYFLNNITSQLVLPAGFSNIAIQKELLRYTKDYAKIYQNIFADAVKLWNGKNETDLTTNISSIIRGLIKSLKMDGFTFMETSSSVTSNQSSSNHNNESRNDVLTIAPEKAIAKGQGIPDFIISKKISSEQEKQQQSVVMMIEFGIGHQFWWKKQDQILLYVELLLKKETSAFTFDQPILLTVITVNKPQTDDDIASTEQTLNVRFGMFLCTRKNTHDYRVALLWRTETSSVKDASTQFGKVLHAAQMCAFLREQEAAMKSYDYLGPNCCRFDSFVRIKNLCVFPNELCFSSDSYTTIRSTIGTTPLKSINQSIKYMVS